MKLKYLLFLNIFLINKNISFCQNKEINPLIIEFQSNYRLKTFDSPFIKFNEKYGEYFNKLKPNAESLEVSPKIIDILRRNNAVLTPVFENQNIELILGRIPKETSCPLPSFVNEFRICILDINDNIDCCNIEKINQIEEQLNSLHLKELKIYKLNLNTIFKNLDKTKIDFKKVNQKKYLKNAKIVTTPLNLNFDKLKTLKKIPSCFCSKYDKILKLQNIRNQIGGLGENATFTLVETQNANNTNFICCSNHDLKLALTFENISDGDSEHTKKDIAILFGDYITSDCQNYGVAPNCQINKIVLSPTQSCLSVDYAIVNAIMRAIAYTPEYGVLLIEFGAGGTTMPAEIIKPIYDLIKLATHCLNIIVVEPAGNGASRIQTSAFYHTDTTTLANIWSENLDSGAIMVGGADRNYNNFKNTYFPSKNLYSNFGNRVDCYGVGEAVCTYYGSHYATSAASAMIAGMVVDIQSIALNKGRYLSPNEMRELFRKPTRRLVRMPITGTGIENRYMPTGDILLQNLDCLLRVNNNCPPCCIEAK